MSGSAGTSSGYDIVMIVENTVDPVFLLLEVEFTSVGEQVALNEVSS